MNKEMPSSTIDGEDVVDRLLDAVVRGDPAGVRACYHPDARIWHNFDEHEQTVDENVALLAAIVNVLSERKYTTRERFAIPGGVGQQHYLDGVLPDGSKFHLPAAIFFKIEDGLITRIDEYFDTAQSDALISLLPEA